MQELRRSRIKSYRFDGGLVDRLERAAKRANVTENAFVSEAREMRLAIDPLVPAFDGLTMGSGVLQSILGASNVDVLEAAASELGQKNFPLIRELYRASGAPLDFKEFVTEILGKNARWFHIEGGGSRTDHWITLHHSYGIKWSKYVRSYLVGAYGTISRDKLKVEITDQFIRIDFSP